MNKEFSHWFPDKALFASCRARALMRPLQDLLQQAKLFAKIYLHDKKTDEKKIV